MGKTPWMQLPRPILPPWSLDFDHLPCGVFWTPTARLLRNWHPAHCHWKGITADSNEQFALKQAGASAVTLHDCPLFASQLTQQSLKTCAKYPPSTNDSKELIQGSCQSQAASQRHPCRASAWKLREVMMSKGIATINKIHRRALGHCWRWLPSHAPFIWSWLIEVNIPWQGSVSPDLSGFSFKGEK